MKEVNRGYYHRHSGLLKVNAGQVTWKNDFTWNSFFELLKLKKQGKPQPFMNKVKPPGYWKDRMPGKRKLLAIIRSDRYYVEKIEEN